MPNFERSEYLQRLAGTKARMDAAGIEVLLVNDPANMGYLSGYDAWSYYTPQLLIVVQDEEEPIWLGRGIDANCGLVTCFMDPANVLGYPDHYVQSTERHPMDYMAAFLTDRGWGGRAMGVEMDSYFYSAAAHASLKKGLPNAAFKPADGLVNWVRVVKSAQEIEYITRAARIVERTMNAALENIVPGVRQCDVVGEILHTQVSGTPEFGGDYPAVMPLLPTGEWSAAPHLTWSDRPFENGGGTAIEIAGCHRRYHCPMARTVCLGEPPQDIRDKAAYVVDGLEAALAAAKPGATAEDVEAAWRKAIAGSGIEKESRIGYSIGLSYPPDWGERTISLRPGDKTVLQADMTLHCIPAIWLGEWGIEISECFRVTERGGVPFAEVPRELFVK